MNLKGLSVLFSTLVLVLFFSCTKINEATELGGDLIPAVDNINTFDTTLDVSTAYYPFDDSVRHTLTGQTSDLMALGKLNDPVFGTTTADMYFSIGLGSQAYGRYPFGAVVDSVKGIDSVVLSLAYQGSYGDSSIASELGVQVYEIGSNNGFKDDSTYRFDHPGFSTTGSVLGSKTFTIRSFKDSIKIVRKGDTTKVANVLRIPLNNSIGNRFKAFDTSRSGIGGYYNDSLFRTLFRGLAVKTTTATGQGALAYFNLVDPNNTRLIVYYRVQRNGIIDSAASVSFGHIHLGQANSITRLPTGDYLANLSKPSPQNLFIQSSPSGSYVSMKIPKLDAFPNKVIHRAELIAYKVPSSSPASDIIFGTPSRLYLDHKGPNNIKDSAYLFENDLQAGLDGSLNFGSFGGNLRSDNSYRFNITRYVQNLVTFRGRNDSLRLFAPLRVNQYSTNLKTVTLPVLNTIANGRVVLASGTAADKNTRLRLRIIYSNL